MGSTATAARRRAAAPTMSGQRSFDDLGTPLAQVTFCVLDLETTGPTVADCEITEIGAIKVRGGEALGTFRTFVNPGQAIPPSITVLTGITDSMVVPAAAIDVVLPTFLEFVGTSVIVGHNIRFDVSFLDKALVRAGYPRLRAPTVDTCALARRLVREEVPDCRLGTLAERFRLDHRPSHRALDDALATCDLLHTLLERAAAYGVTGLDDLLTLPRQAGHPQVAKLRLTSKLPRRPGVYLFRDRGGRVLYVGKASDLRSRVRSYFGSDDRRRIGPMLREAQGIDHHPCDSALEASVLEARLLHALKPRYNRQGIRWDRAAYVRLDPGETYPRLTVARSHRGKGVVLGPFSSAAAARLAVDAIESVVPLRRCTNRIPVGGLPVRAGPCAPAQLGVAHCPCAGGVCPGEYGALVDRVERGLTLDPALLLDPLAARIAALASAERYEEAAAARDRAAALAEGLRRTRRFDALRRAEAIDLELPGGQHVRLERGVLRATWADGELPGMGGPIGRGLVDEPPVPPPAGQPLPAEAADELSAVASFLDRYAGRVRVAAVDGEWAMTYPKLPTFRPPRAR